ncbi:MAG TPA: hypothetical protein VK250_04925 [Nitrososphaeraceae archaeon]|nr:hypothetical protein [Nitrososphaeraceae archaeon]
MVLKDTVNTDTLIKLYKIYDGHRDAILWFLEELDVDSYEEYIQKYGGSSIQRSYFIAVCGFFELSGVIVSHRMIDADLYFDMFNPTPFWNKAKSVVQGMRKKRPHIYENFEMLNNKRIGWTKKRESDTKKASHNIKQKRSYKL